MARWGIWEQPIFGEKEDNDNNNTNINMQQHKKVKKLREGGFCVFCFFFFNVFIKPKFFFITNNLVITYKLSTIEGFYYKERVFATILVFIGFCHILGKIAKEKEKKMCC
jgi:hypothetical protein